MNKKLLLFSVVGGLLLFCAAAIVGIPASLADTKLPAPNPTSANTTKTTIVYGLYLDDAGAYLGLKGDAAATSATAVYSDNFTTQTSGKIHSFRTGGSEKAYIDFAGVLQNTTGGGFNIADSTGTAATLGTIAASSASQTTETALALTQSGVTTGYTGKFVALTGSSTTGAGDLLDLTCVNTSGGTCENITSNALTTGTAFIIPHTTSVIASGGSLLRLSSTSVDTGTTTGTLLDLSATGSVAANLVNIAASNASQTTETALAVTQSGTTTGFTGKFVDFTCSSTTGSGSCVVVDSVNTTGGNAFLVNANSATASTAVGLSVSATALTTGTAVKIKGGSEANVTTAGRYLSVQDSAGNEVFSVGADTHQVFAQATLPVVTNTGGSGPSCAGCTDSNGKIVATTAANTNVITLTFNTSATPRGCLIAPADANTAVDLKAAGGGVVTVSAGNFTISAPSANWAANQKNIFYSCFF